MILAGVLWGAANGNLSAVTQHKEFHLRPYIQNNANQ